MITIRQSRDFSKITKSLNRMKRKVNTSILEKYGEKGIKILSSVTPVETGLTASSWYYKIEQDNNSISLSFYNSHVNKGVNIAIILQYGHGTRNGGWVEGRDYINPAVQPLFDQITNDLWKEVTNE